MQFANSDIEDLKIVEEEQTIEPVLPTPSPKQRISIHDDPAIVSAVMSKDVPTSNHLIEDFQQLNLQSKRTDGKISKKIDC